MKTMRVLDRNTRVAKDFEAYAKEYNVSFASAARDRDYPMNAKELSEIFFAGLGRLPTEDELKEMSPDSEAAIQDYIREEWE